MDPEANDFVATLPEELRGHEALKDVKDLPSLAKSYIDAHDKASIVPGELDGFPEEAKTDPVFNRYKTKAEIYKGLKEANALIGRKGLIVPNANSKPEEVSAFVKSLPEAVRKEMGWPDKPEGYQFKMPQGLHKELGITPEALKPWAETFHKLNLTQGQAEGVLHAYLALGNNSLVARDKERLDATKSADIALRNDADWSGQKFDENMQVAIAVLSKTGGEPLVKAFSALSDSDPFKVPMIKALAKIGKEFVEGGARRLGFSSLTIDKQSAQQKINEMNDAAARDRKHPLVNASHPDYKKMRVEMEELYKIANS